MIDRQESLLSKSVSSAAVVATPPKQLFFI